MTQKNFPKGMEPVLHRLRTKSLPLEERVQAADSGSQGNPSERSYDLTNSILEEHLDGNGGTALDLAHRYCATESAYIASLPLLIAGLSQGNEFLWQNYPCTGASVEIRGVDTRGQYVGVGKEVIIILHGAYLTIPKEISDHLKDRTASNKYGVHRDVIMPISQDTVDKLLRGWRLPDGTHIDLYTVKDVIEGKVKDPFGMYAVVLSAQAVSGKLSDHNKASFLASPLVIARAGTTEFLEAYFDQCVARDTNESLHYIGFKGMHKADEPHLLNYVGSDATDGVVLTFLRAGANGFTSSLKDLRFITVKPNNT